MSWREMLCNSSVSIPSQLHFFEDSKFGLISTTALVASTVTCHSQADLFPVGLDPESMLNHVGTAENSIEGFSIEEK
jgi:hypothetical protein